jgi:hypothetical protein
MRMQCYWPGSVAFQLRISCLVCTCCAFAGWVYACGCVLLTCIMHPHAALCMQLCCILTCWCAQSRSGATHIEKGLACCVFQALGAAVHVAVAQVLLIACSRSWL